MRKKAPIIIAAMLAAGAIGYWLVVGGIQGKPMLSLSFSHYETNNGFVFGVIHLTNSGAGAASYVAHSFGSDAPYYSLMTHSPTGWAYANLGWCGTEMHPSVLAASSELKFNVHLPTNQTWKVGIIYKDASSLDNVGSIAPRFWRRYLGRFSSSATPGSTVWSPPIHYGSE